LASDDGFIVLQPSWSSSWINQDLQNNVARDVRNSWLNTRKARQRLSVTKRLREEAHLALELAESRYRLGLGTIVEFSQAELQKTDADIQDTDARYE